MRKFISGLLVGLALVAGIAIAGGDLTGENIYFAANETTPTVGMASGTQLNWTASATTGVGAKDAGVRRSAAGVVQVTNGATTNAGLQAATVGPASTQQHTLPAVTSDTVTLIAASQTLTNKTLTSPTMSAPTISGAASLTGTLSTSGSGRILPTSGMQFFDDFTQDTLQADYWATNQDAGGTLWAISAGLNGRIAGVTDTTTNDKMEVAGEVIWTTSAVTYFETRIKVSAITDACINVGLSDAKAEAAQVVAWTVGGSDVVTTNTDDGVGFAFDTGATTDGWFGVVSASTDDKEGAGATAPAADTYVKLAFSIDASRLVTFYINDAAYGSVSTALDASTLLCPYLAIQSRNNTARTVTVDYIYVWQAR